MPGYGVIYYVECAVMLHHDMTCASLPDVAIFEESGLISPAFHPNALCVERNQLPAVLFEVLANCCECDNRSACVRARVFISWGLHVFADEVLG